MVYARPFVNALVKAVVRTGAPVAEFTNHKLDAGAVPLPGLGISTHPEEAEP